LAPHKALKSRALSSPGKTGRVAQWVAAAGAALQHGGTSVHTAEAAQVAQEEANVGAEAAKQQEVERAVVGETSTAKTDEATMAKANEATTAKADEGDERVAPTGAERAVAEAALTSPQPDNQSGGHGKEREVHTISSDEPPRPHGKAVMDAKVSSTMEMAPRVHRRGKRSRGTWPLFASGPVHGLSRRLSSWAALRRRKHTGRSLRALGI
jgi:hypothetical protein